MVNSGIVKVVVSCTKLFSGADLAKFSGSNVVEALIDECHRTREFDSIKVEVITQKNYTIKFSGDLSAPLPSIDEIIPVMEFESSLRSLANPSQFKFHASVRLSVEYPFEEFEDYIVDAQDQGDDNPNVLSWISYCASDAVATLSENLRDEGLSKTDFTVRGF